MKPLLLPTVASFIKSSPKSWVKKKSYIQYHSCFVQLTKKHLWDCSSWYKADASHCAIFLTLDWADLS